MKRLSILQLSFVLFVFLGFYSCSKESIDTKKDAGLNQRAERLSHKGTNLTSASGSGFMDNIITDPALEWWHDKEGTMPSPYIYDIYTGTSPESPASPDTSAHYISILWNSYPPYFGYAGNNYKRLQIQYKQYDNSPWCYPKTEAPENDNPWGIIYKQYGFFQRTVDPIIDRPMDLSSTSFPYGYIKIRIRVVSNDFPGPNISYGPQPEYDKNLATEWSYKILTKWNEYGFRRPQPTPNTSTNTWNDEADDDGVLNVKVWLPEDNDPYTYSYYVVVGGEYVNGAIAPWGREGSHNISKQRKSGIARAVAIETFHYLNGGTQEKTRTKTMQYSAQDKTASFTFSKSDF